MQIVIDPKRLERAKSIDLDKIQVEYQPQKVVAEVPSERGGKFYKVEITPTSVSCECPDHKTRGNICKHIIATTLKIKQEKPDFEFASVDVESPSAVNSNYIYGRPAPEFLIDIFNTVSDNVLLKGPRGTGKNFVLQQVAEVTGRVLYRLSFSYNTDESVVLGHYTLNDKKQMIYRYGVVARAVKLSQKKPVMLIMDEINALRDPMVLASLFTLLDDGKFLELPNGDKIERGDLWIAATMNPGYAGTSEMNEALRDRFFSLEFHYDIEIDKKILTEKGIADGAAERFIGFVNSLRDNGVEISYRATQIFADLIASGIGEQTAYTILVNHLFDDQTEKESVIAALPSLSNSTSVLEELKLKIGG